MSQSIGAKKPRRNRSTRRKQRGLSSEAKALLAIAILLAVGAAVFTGAMAELAQQWLAGNLGDDLDAVVDAAVALVL